MMNYSTSQKRRIIYTF